MCMSNKQYTTVKVIGTLLSVVCKVLRSFVFNVFLFMLGFAFGYICIASKVHYYAIQHEDAVYLQNISDKIDEMAAMDIIYTKKQEEAKTMIKELKAKFSHDVYHECENPIW